MPSRQHMVLSAFFYNPQGDHRLSWRHDNAPKREIFDLDYYRKLVEAAEQAKLDTIFIADHLGIWDTYESGVAHYANARLEPLSLVSALAAVTKDIGFIVTASTSYTEPFNIARTFASMDHISKGRVGWNVVTSALEEEARNFGLDGNIRHATRYQRAGEFLDVVKKLWDSWEDDALLIDKKSGYFADPSKIHYLDHAGEHFKVRGPLNVARSPQGHPLLVQAGSSESGKELATDHTDVHFAVFKSEEEGRRYRADINQRLAQKGRAPDSFVLLPGVLPIVAASRDEAAERHAALEDLMIDRVSIDLLSSWSGVDLSSYPLDGPLPELPDESTFDGWRTWLNIVKNEANKGLTIRQLARKIANTGSVPILSGSPVDVADQLEAWFVAGIADGYNLMFPLLPDDWINFTQSVVPELQRRGLFRTAYEPGTFRERLGLRRPDSQFARGVANPASTC
ncbi:LLM class flavin-dependent oxidoreductase [Rhizobium multihospitium]|uniref:FMN-dependent oxidoreductase, nitrilotriacetate monooxygenase family n=1 Tax=Rhizobium multihospitium TaxID=410764 RepID=A0A1C3WW41_9HYPH|nr:LLM class flavin-dependent oxidoreductase [Rhizobium multihospitium]SCB44191.1 FMN-dependent oxidoreductase, nitrilotriacetate monooxygenase family [Rhizobium multihospitium]